MTSPARGSTKGVLAAAGLFAVGLLVGFVGGRIRHPTLLAGPDVGGSTPGARSDRPAVSAVTLSEGEGGALRRIRRSMDISDPVIALAQFTDALQEMSAAEVAEASSQLWATPGSQQENTLRKRLLSYRWGQLAGAEAVEFVQAQSGQGKVTALSAALAGWASLDPGAAKVWINDQDPLARSLYELALIDGWSRTDLAGATAHVLERPSDPQAEQMIRVLGTEQLRRLPERAGEWALALPAGALRSAALDEVVNRWTWDDPATAVSWVSQMTDSAALSAAMKTAMGIWARADPNSAGAYLQEMKVGEGRDYAVAAFSRTAASEAPSASAAWAATISDSALREESLLAVARTWLRKDPQAAFVWLPTSGLSDEALAELTPQ